MRLFCHCSTYGRLFITALTCRYLNEFKNVRYVSTGITTLPEDLFYNTTLLEYLALDSNAIISLPEGLFTNMPNLQHLVLQANGLTSLPPKLFYSNRAPSLYMFVSFVLSVSLHLHCCMCLFRSC